MVKVSEDDKKVLRRQLFKANNKSAMMSAKKDTREETLAELKEIISVFQMNVIARGKKMDDIEIQEFSDFYLITSPLSPHEYFLNDKPINEN